MLLAAGAKGHVTKADGPAAAQNVHSEVLRLLLGEPTMANGEWQLMHQCYWMLLDVFL